VASTGGSSGGNPHTLYDVSGVGDWYAGVKAGATLTYTIGVGGTPGTADRFQIDTNGASSVYDAGTMRAVGFRGAPGRTMSSQGSILATDNGKRITCNFSGGTLTIANVAASGLLTDGIVVVTNYLASVSLVMTTGTINWFNGSSVVLGSRTLAIGAVVTIVMDAQDSSVHLWGTGIS
jgi:hypothetical protein